MKLLFQWQSRLFIDLSLWHGVFKKVSIQSSNKGEIKQKRDPFVACSLSSFRSKGLEGDLMLVKGSWASYSMSVALRDASRLVLNVLYRGFKFLRRLIASRLPDPSLQKVPIFAP